MPDSSHNPARIAFIRRFKWDTVTTFSQNEEVHSLAVNDLVTQLERANISCAATITFGEANFKDQLQMLRVIKKSLSGWHWWKDEESFSVLFRLGIPSSSTTFALKGRLMKLARYFIFSAHLNSKNEGFSVKSICNSMKIISRYIFHDAAAASSSSFLKTFILIHLFTSHYH